MSTRGSKITRTSDFCYDLNLGVQSSLSSGESGIGHYYLTSVGEPMKNHLKYPFFFRERESLTDEG